MKDETVEFARIMNDLTLFNDKLMSRVFDGNIEAAEYLLRTILERDDIHVKSVKGQYNIKSPAVGGRSITLDIRAEETDGREFDVEVQNDAKGAHVRRARFHSCMMDARLLKEKEDFRYMKDSFVIFIYSRDKFRMGLPLYHIERNVKETGRDFGDGSHIIYVNGKYEGDDEIGRLIHDLKCRNADDIYNRDLAEGVRHYKESEEGSENMKDLWEKYGDRREKEGKKKGEKRGEKRGARQTSINNVKSLMETMALTIDQALDALKIEEKKERTLITKAVKG